MARKEEKKEEKIVERYIAIDQNGVENKPFSDLINNRIKGKIVASIGTYFIIEK